MTSIAHTHLQYQRPIPPLNRVQWVHIPSAAWSAVAQLRQRDSALLSAVLLQGLARPLTPDPFLGGAYHPLPVVVAPALAAVLDSTAVRLHVDARKLAGMVIALGLQQPAFQPIVGRAAAAPSATIRDFRQWLGTTIARAAAQRRPKAPPPELPFTREEARERRMRMGLSQRDLAAASGYSRGWIAEFERGTRTGSLTSRYALAKVLWPTGYQPREVQP